MLRRTPKYMNELIKSGVRRQAGPAVTNISDIAASNRLQQAGEEMAVENAGQQLNLGKARLTEQGRQFQQRLGLAKSNFDWQKKEARSAENLAALGTGISIYDYYQSKKMADERLAARKKIIDKYRQAGDEDSQFFADMLEAM